jgi:hypothetical protein
MKDSEKEVAFFLRDRGLRWSYESPIFIYDDKDRPRVWTPDFYIPKLGMYIEVCGTDDFNYEYREKIYKKNGFHVIFIHVYKEPDRWKSYLIKRIMEIEEERHDEVMDMIKHSISKHKP